MVTKRIFDRERNAYIYELSNGKLAVGLTDFGAAIQYLKVATDSGEVDVCLGFDNVDDYIASGMYCGATVGRVVNRIRKGQFALNGETYQLTVNDGNNHLHGGIDGFDRRLYNVIASDDCLRFSLLSPDGDQGYPCELQLTVEYKLHDNALEIIYSAVSHGDVCTIWSPTCHAYFNLNGKGNIYNNCLRINSNGYTPIDSELLPTGEILSVEGTPFDFTKLKPIGRDIDAEDAQLYFGSGYDHNYVLNGDHAATAVGEQSAIQLDLFTDLPGMQLYSGNFIKGNGKCGTLTPRQGFCLEPQYFPDAINNPQFVLPILQPHQEKRHYIRYEFTCVRK